MCMFSFFPTMAGREQCQTELCLDWSQWLNSNPYANSTTVFIRSEKIEMTCSKESFLQSIQNEIERDLYNR